MAASASSVMPDTDDRTLTIERIFDAPREMVYGAWTDPKRGLGWMGPRHAPAFHVEGEVKAGGKWRMGLRTADGRDLWQGGVYREVSPPRRLVFTTAWDQEDGSSGPETVITLTFEDIGGKTRMTFHQGVFNTVSNRDGHRGGWNSGFDRLAEYLAGRTSA
jgi:uncharacterized protein YndB with AHSA1/START domain